MGLAFKELPAFCSLIYNSWPILQTAPLNFYNLLRHCHPLMAEIRHQIYFVLTSLEKQDMAGTCCWCKVLFYDVIDLLFIFEPRFDTCGGRLLSAPQLL